MCLEQDYNKVKLKKCNEKEDKQIWYFVRLPTSHGYHKYRIMNADTFDFIQLDGDDIIMKDNDPDDMDQWVKGLKHRFFKMQ